MQGEGCEHEIKTLAVYKLSSCLDTVSLWPFLDRVAAHVLTVHLQVTFTMFPTARGGDLEHEKGPMFPFPISRAQVVSLLGEATAPPL